MAEGMKNAKASRKIVALPSPQEADVLAGQLNQLMGASMSIQRVIDADVQLGVFDSPFVHPLYQINVKLDGMRGKKARRLSQYARQARKEAAKKAS